MYINKRLKFIIVTVIVIFFLLTIAVFQFNQNKNYNLAKQELANQVDPIEQAKKELDEYKLKVVNQLQQTNEKVEEIQQTIKFHENQLRQTRLKRRCLDYQLERITTNKDYHIDYCDNDENLEQFKEVKQVEIQQANNNEPKQVVF